MSRNHQHQHSPYNRPPSHQSLNIYSDFGSGHSSKYLRRVPFEYNDVGVARNISRQQYGSEDQQLQGFLVHVVRESVATAIIGDDSYTDFACTFCFWKDSSSNEKLDLEPDKGICAVTIGSEWVHWKGQVSYDSEDSSTRQYPDFNASTEGGFNMEKGDLENCNQNNGSSRHAKTDEPLKGGKELLSKQHSQRVVSASQEKIRRRNLLYGFNLPTGERLRTRNAQALREAAAKGKNVLVQRYFSSGESLMLSSGLILRGFTEKTTSHGLPHIYFASGVLKKSIWMLVSVAAFVVLCLHLYLLIVSWRASEVGSRLTWEWKRKITFPAVTICNYNALKLSTINDQGNIRELINGSTAEAEKGGQRRIALTTNLLERLTEEYANLTDEDFLPLGHNVTELAIFCSFHGEECSAGDFFFFRDSRYGNCLTFNSGRSSNGGSNNTNNSEEEEEGEGGLKFVSAAGPQFGLSLVIFVDQFEYVPILTEAVGARVVIHNQTVMPFPEQNAISVTSNTLVNIGIKKSIHGRLSGRFGNCTDINDNGNNIYHDKFKVDYSQTACLKTCYQRHTADRCKCYDPTIPFDHKSDVFRNFQRALPICRSSNPDNRECLITAKDDYEDAMIPCNYCHNPCDESTFDTKHSSAIWPATSYIKDFIKELRFNYPTILRRIEKEARKVNGIVERQNMTGTQNAEQGTQAIEDEQFNAQVEELVKSNFIKLNIYYEEMQVAKYQEISIYDDYQFASDIGGSFGLWVGWSIISMVEFLELFLDLLVFLCYACCGKRKRQQNQHSATLDILHEKKPEAVLVEGNYVRP